MTIYSNDPALADLWENRGGSDAHGLCTKYHYALVRIYDGDEGRLLRDVAGNDGRLP